MYEDLLGVPFTNRGRTPKGYDCYGLAQEIFRRHGQQLPEYTADFEDVDRVHAVMVEGLTHWRKLPAPKVPCLVVMRFAADVVNHVGVYIGNGRFIHTRQRVGVCIERLDSPMWKRLIEGYYEYNNDYKKPIQPCGGQRVPQDTGTGESSKTL